MGSFQPHGNTKKLKFVDFLSQISPRIRIYIRNRFSQWISGPRGIVWRKNQWSKISWDCPFQIRLFLRLTSCSWGRLGLWECCLLAVRYYSFLRLTFCSWGRLGLWEFWLLAIRSDSALGLTSCSWGRLGLWECWLLAIRSDSALGLTSCSWGRLGLWECWLLAIRSDSALGLTSV
jgi:hypothetical protein